MTLSPPTNRKTVLATLRQARKFVVQGWTKHALARPRDGRKRTQPRSVDACSVCAVGAVRRATASWAVSRPAEQALAAATRQRSIISVNDRARSVETVLRIFDKAIAKEVAK
jgi:hypothetical protein